MKNILPKKYPTKNAQSSRAAKEAANLPDAV